MLNLLYLYTYDAVILTTLFLTCFFCMLTDFAFFFFTLGSPHLWSGQMAEDRGSFPGSISRSQRSGRQRQMAQLALTSASKIKVIVQKNQNEKENIIMLSRT